MNATFLRQINADKASTQHIYKLDPPVNGVDQVIVSALPALVDPAGNAARAAETCIFAYSEGDILGDLLYTLEGWADHHKALAAWEESLPKEEGK